MCCFMLLLFAFQQQMLEGRQEPCDWELLHGWQWLDNRQELSSTQNNAHAEG